jgi:hypothetical protein
MMTRFKLFGRSQFLTRFLYKSGQTVDVWLVACKVTRGDKGISEVTWETAGLGVTKPLALNVDELAAVWQVGAKINMFSLIAGWMSK